MCCKGYYYEYDYDCGGCENGCMPGRERADGAGEIMGATVRYACLSRTVPSRTVQYINIVGNYNTGQYIIYDASFTLSVLTCSVH